MIIFSNAETLSLLNFLVDQLIRDEVPFQFVEAHDKRWRTKMNWIRNDDPVALVDSIVDQALINDACLLISAVSHKETENGYNKPNGFFVGFVPVNS